MIVIHHSASNLAATVEQITEWHKARNFETIGYHFVILQNGHVKAGRPVEKIGAHAHHHNLKSIGICVTGDNTRPGSSWTQNQIGSLRALVDTLKIFWPSAEVLGHRDLPGAATECPGLNVRALLERGNESWMAHSSVES